MANRHFIHRLLVVATLSCAFPVTQPVAVAQGPGSTQERKLDRASKVTVQNKTGQIHVTGWEGDTVRASATRGGESVPLRMTDEVQDGLVVSPDARGGGDVSLEVSVPRSVLLVSVTAASASVAVEGIDNAVTIAAASGDIRVAKVGSLEARSASGNLTVADVAGGARVSTQSGNLEVSGVGSIEVETQSGNVTLTNVRGGVEIRAQSSTIIANDVKGNFVAQAMSGDIEAAAVGGLAEINVVSGNVTLRGVAADVRAFSLSGEVTVECVKGRVDATNASGSIHLAGVGGDIEAQTASGDISYTGVLRASGRYRMKTTSGDVRMAIQADAPGFTATLSAYTGDIETEFPLKVEFSNQRGQINRRLIGRYGDGSVQITLNSFDGTVSLAKAAQSAEKDCK